MCIPVSAPSPSARFPPFLSSIFPKVESATVSGALPPDYLGIFLKSPIFSILPPFSAFSLDANQ